ncbi:MAG: hypothetical protein V1837_03580 [Candidatus Woesearchaeota archaeon]
MEVGYNVPERKQEQDYALSIPFLPPEKKDYAMGIPLYGGLPGLLRMYDNYSQLPSPNILPDSVHQQFDPLQRLTESLLRKGPDTKIMSQSSKEAALCSGCRQ